MSSSNNLLVKKLSPTISVCFNWYLSPFWFKLIIPFSAKLIFVFVIFTGLVVCSGAPCPTWPCPSYPTVHVLPFSSIINPVWYDMFLVHAIANTFLSVCVWYSVVLFVVLSVKFCAWSAAPATYIPFSPVVTINSLPALAMCFIPDNEYPVLLFFIYVGDVIVVAPPVPNCPSEFSPTPYAYPSFCNINVLYSPHAISFTSDNPCISRGVDVFSLLLYTNPNCESEFRPAAHTVPSAVNTAVCKFPAAICITFVTFIIWDGVKSSLLTVVPSPYSPQSFLPHDHTVPSFFNTCIVFEPADICITSVKFGTCLNSDEFVVVPSPSCPYVLSPEIHTVPSFFNIAVK